MATIPYKISKKIFFYLQECLNVILEIKNCPLNHKTSGIEKYIRKNDTKEKRIVHKIQNRVTG